MIDAKIPQVTPSIAVARKAIIHCDHSTLETFHKNNAGLISNILFNAMNMIAAKVAIGSSVSKLVMNKHTKTTNNEVTKL